MKTKDLRLGNLIAFKALNPNEEEIEHRGIVTVITQNSVFMGDSLHIPIELVVPVPITIELLKKARFKFHAHRGLSLFPFGKMADPFFSYVDELDELWYGTPGDVYTTELKYVHQLQNLYFALTGEELTLSI